MISVRFILSFSFITLSAIKSRCPFFSSFSDIAMLFRHIYSAIDIAADAIIAFFFFFAAPRHYPAYYDDIFFLLFFIFFFFSLFSFFIHYLRDEIILEKVMLLSSQAFSFLFSGCHHSLQVAVVAFHQSHLFHSRGSLTYMQVSQLSEENTSSFFLFLLSFHCNVFLFSFSSLLYSLSAGRQKVPNLNDTNQNEGRQWFVLPVIPVLSHIIIYLAARQETYDGDWRAITDWLQYKTMLISCHFHFLIATL